jgi:hypothetical protein
MHLSKPSTFSSVVGTKLRRICPTSSGGTIGTGKEGRTVAISGDSVGHLNQYVGIEYNKNKDAERHKGHTRGYTW